MTLNNASLNYVGPLVLGYFSVVNTEVLHGLWLVESVDVEEPCIWRADYKNYIWINPWVVQGSSVLFFLINRLICLLPVIGFAFYDLIVLFENENHLYVLEVNVRYTQNLAFIHLCCFLPTFPFPSPDKWSCNLCLVYLSRAPCPHVSFFLYLRQNVAQYISYYAQYLFHLTVFLGKIFIKCWTNENFFSYYSLRIALWVWLLCKFILFIIASLHSHEMGSVVCGMKWLKMEKLYILGQS